MSLMILIHQKHFFENRYKYSENIIIVAYYNEMPIDYVMRCNEFKCNKECFYCWLAGVEHRYMQNGYKYLKIKTRNRYKQMLGYLVKNNWNYTSVEEKGTI